MEPIYYREALAWIAIASDRLAAARIAEGLLPGRADRPVVHAALDALLSRVRDSRTLASCRSRSLGAVRLRRGARAHAGTLAARRHRRSPSAWSSSRRSVSGFPSSIPRWPCSPAAVLATGEAAAHEAPHRAARRTTSARTSSASPTASSVTTSRICWSWTTRRRTAPGRSPTSWPRATPAASQVLHRQGPRGLGLAYVDGLKRALASDADAIGQMDADLSHDPEVPAGSGRRRSTSTTWSSARATCAASASSTGRSIGSP